MPDPEMTSCPMAGRLPLERRINPAQSACALKHRVWNVRAGLMSDALHAPGVVEYQLGALAKFIFLNGGAQDEGYRAIIAGGANIWHMHYAPNNQALCDGDLVPMDYAPDYHYYVSDIAACGRSAVRTRPNNANSTALW